MWTDERIRELHELGVTLVRGLVPVESIRAMCDRLWADLLERVGAHPAKPETWIKGERPARFKMLTRAGVFSEMESPAVSTLLDGVFGLGQWERPTWWGKPLVTFPRREGKWDVPRKGWHLDLPARPNQVRLPAVRLFVFLDSVKAQGGGTVVVIRSHCLVAALASDREFSSRAVRRELARRDPWLAALEEDAVEDRVRYFMQEGSDRQGGGLRVVELQGEPGDAVLMDSRVLHAAAPNHGDRPRLMLAQPICRLDQGPGLWDLDRHWGNDQRRQKVHE